VNAIEQANRAASLVGLEMPNQMPTRCLMPKLQYLSFGLLDPIFAQVGNPDFQSSPHQRSCVRFANRNYLDFIKCPP
jgi:hypothetical protein